MAAKIDLKARRELVRAVAERYRHASKRDKRRILDQFVAITGYHRKHSIRLLNSTAELVAPRRTTRFRVYDEAVREALIVLWEASHRICGKRLKALLPTLVPALERHGHLRLDEAVGFSPDFADTSKKADNEPGGVSWRRAAAIVRSA